MTVNTKARGFAWEGVAVLPFALALSLFGACAPGPEGAQGDPGRVGRQGPEGPVGAGFPTPPSLRAISPGGLTPGRTAELAISGSDTRWTEGGTPQVIIGAGVTVKKVLVGSDTGLIVEVEVAQDAQPGRRNVTVSSNGEVLVATGGFNVRRSLEVSHAPDTVGRPSLAAVEIIRHDPELELPQLDSDYGFELPEGMSAGLHAVEENRALLWLGTDLDAATGTHEVVVRVFPGEPRERVLSIPVTVSEASVGVLQEGGNESGVGAWSSTAGTFATESPSVVDLAVQASQGKAPSLFVLGTSGSFEDLVAGPDAQSFFALPEETYYLLAWETGGTEAYFQLDITATPASSTVTEQEPNETAATAQVIAGLPASIPTANLTTVSDVDWFRVSLPTSSVGKSIHVLRTSGGADVAVQVIAADGTTVLGDSPNLFYTPSWVGPQVTQKGVHYFRFYNPTGSFAGSYAMELTLQ